DPVENASLMPWLISTALLHSLAVTEKRGAFKNWTVLLALSAFSLSLLGTFLVRSGVLTSVHAFASDPTRGLFILVFLCVIIGGSLILYAFRAPGISIGGSFDLISRETFLLANNLILTVFAIIILFGTLAPLVYDAMQWGKISVGFPWFNAMFVAIMPLLGILMGFGSIVPWKRSKLGLLLKNLSGSFVLSIIVGVGIVTWLSAPFYVALGLALAVWLVSSHLTVLWLRVWRTGFLPTLKRLMGQNRSFFGMWIAHVGVACFIVGITVVSHYSLEEDLYMNPNDKHDVAGYQFLFTGVTNHTGPNYQTQRGHFTVTKDNQHDVILEPEKRTYNRQGMP
ncbi:hypothetical protein TI03_06030, partial [Achromatium sp. WMS1]